MLFRSGIVLLMGAVCASAAPITFNFDTDTGSFTPFTDTVDGLSATFTSPADPGGFAVGSSFFSTLTGGVLLDPGPASANGLPLTISFNALLGSLSLDFATNSGVGVPLQLQAFDDALPAGATSAMGTIPPGFSFPEGSISISGAFNEVVLSSTAFDFAIDNIAVTLVPEPSDFVLIGLALGACALLRFRSRGQLRNAASSSPLLGPRMASAALGSGSHPETQA